MKNDKLFEHFIISLRMNFQQVVRDAKGNEVDPELMNEIKHLLESAMSWQEACKAEQLMIALMTGKTLDAMLKRQILKVDRLGKDKEIVIQHYKDEYENAKTDRDKQAVMRHLTQDIQWHYEMRRMKQQYIHRAWLVVSFAFLISFVLFFSPKIFPFIKELLPLMKDARSSDIFTAITSGALGASFSMLISLQARLEGSSLYVLETIQKAHYVFFRVFIGIGSGLIFFYFLQSGLLAGSIFPDWEELERAADPSQRVQKDLGLLIVWCFLSGFSEQLLPNILSKTEDQANLRTLEQAA
jgi:hypothetical protein